MNPDRESDLRLDVAAEHGLENGNLKPLAELLRSGAGLSDEVRSLLADAIEGRGRFRPMKLTHKSGWLAEDKKRQRRAERLRIGAFIHLRSLRSDRGQWDSIVSQAATGFNVSGATAAKALTEFRAWQDEAGPEDFWLKAVVESAWQRAFPEEYRAFLESLPE